MVYWVSLPKEIDNKDCRRPCIIVSNNVGNIHGSTLIVVPCTSNLDRLDSQPTHMTIQMNNQRSIVLCENITMVSKLAAENFIGMLEENELKSLDEILKITLGLAPVPESKVRFDTTPKEEKKDNKNLSDLDSQKKYIEDFEQYGVEYCMKLYNIPTSSAAYARKSYYKNKIKELSKSLD